MFLHHMIWHTPRPALLLGAALALTGLAFAPGPAAAQQAASPAAVSAASAAPAPGASETTAPRRRPTRRTTARLDSVSVRTVSDRSAADRAAAAERSAMLAIALRVEGRNWIGIPYRWGGTSRRGIDCSAFTQQFVRETMGIELPRATAGQQYEGVPVSRGELRPGDLVFFRRGGTRHVGVFVGEDEFIHASTSRGVIVSSLSDSYWSRTYWMARRILNEPSGRRPIPRSSARGDSMGVRG